MIPGRSQAAGRDELNFNTLCSRPTWYGALHRFGSPRGATIELPLESEGYSEASTNMPVGIRPGPGDGKSDFGNFGTATRANGTA